LGSLRLPRRRRLAALASCAALFALALAAPETRAADARDEASPTPVPKEEPRLEPLPGPRAAPRTAPRTEPRREPQPQPEPRTEPEPQPEPRTEPQPRPPEKERYFFHGYDYGSESIYNPATVFVNRGFDMMQLGDDHNDPWHFDYATNASNVANNVLHAPSRIGEEGWNKFLKQEIFPFSWRQDTARWVPNYTLHLLGGGQTFAMLDEWFDAHHVPAPWAFSALTLMSAAFVNETIENGGVTGRNTDCLADLLVFDIGGILFFSSPAVRRFFSRHVKIMDWSQPPALSWPKFELRNQGNYYATRYALPFYERLGLFSYFGAWTTFGLSYRVGEYNLSVSGGAASTKLYGTATNLVENAVTFVPAAAIFLDRNGSLLASIKLADLPDYLLQLQAFPGMIPTAKWLGGFAAVSRNGHFLAGVSATIGFGVGFRTGNLQATQ
jgi:hypothetical protein